MVERLQSRIREVPDFPKEGILFYDITTILSDAASFKEAVDLLSEPFRDAGVELVVAMESRGFLFGTPIAYHLNAGFIPIRKAGKLPADKITRAYTLEYATNTLEMHRDAIRTGQRVLIVDDLLATGGTIAASLDIVKELGGVAVGVVVLIELEFLGGRERLAPYGVEIISFIKYR